MAEPVAVPQSASEIERSLPTQPAPPGSERLISLDAFRGIVMLLMVLVNNAGSGAIYRQFRHSAWNGWTITDAVFPSFLWIVGVAITLSLGKRVRSGASARSLLPSILRRSALLFVFGLAIYAPPSFNPSTQRILGVLQRIAICYLIGSIIYLSTRVRGQIVWIFGLLTGYWLLMMLVPVPGFGAGNLTVEGNFAHYIDSIVLGRHNYASTKTWDPEGIISTLPSIATVLFGIMAGHILRLKRPLSERVAWLFLAGSCLLAAGLVCDAWLPINKKLWTSSFSLFMAGLDFTVFSAFLWLVDGCGWKRAARPLVVMGMNAIAVYMLAEFFDIFISNVHAGGVSIRHWIFQTIFVPLASPSLAALLYALAYTALMYAFAYVLYRKRWFLKV